jgi:hypothetical protein
MSKQKYFTKEEKRIAHNAINEKCRRKKGIVARKKFNTESEKIIAGIEYQKQYYQNHKEEKKETQKKYQETHKEERKKYFKTYSKTHNKEIKLKKQKYYQNNKEILLKRGKEYNKKHKEEIKFRHFNRLKTDINYKLANDLRTRLYHALKDNQKSGSAVKDLGCSIPEFKTYLESKFQEGMSWKNWGVYGWHIDHIIPISSFNLQNRKEFLKANHYTNLQPMWAEENIRKNNKIG